MLDLTPEHLAVLERLRAAGFALAAFPMYERHIGVRRGDCALLLAPGADGRLGVFGEPCWLVEGKLAVRVRREGREWFVFKQARVEATPERLAELAAFRAAVELILAAHA
jgi:hypothetical protein